jgi:hypothetical protein
MNPTWHRQRLGRLTLAALSLAAAAPVIAETVQRCESADGKVTYSNTQCPGNLRDAQGQHVTAGRSR